MKNLILSGILGLASTSFAAPSPQEPFLKCKAVAPQKLNVNIFHDRNVSEDAVIQVIDKNGVVYNYKAKEKTVKAVGSRYTLVSKKVKFSINFTSAPQPGGVRMGLLETSLLGFNSEIEVLCKR